MKTKQKKRDYKLEVPEVELYFIQFLFCENRALLAAKYRGLYNALFSAYEQVYKAGKEARMDLMTINNTFKKIL